MYISHGNERRARANLLRRANRQSTGGFPGSMRQRLFIGAIFGVFLAVTLAAVPARAEFKFAYVDVQRALNECDAGKRAKADFQGRVTSLEGRLQRQQNEVQSLKDEMEKKGMLMNPDRGGVDHLQIALVSLRNGLENPVPDAQLAPEDKAVRFATVKGRSAGLYVVSKEVHCALFNSAMHSHINRT